MKHNISGRVEEVDGVWRLVVDIPSDAVEAQGGGEGGASFWADLMMADMLLGNTLRGMTVVSIGDGGKLYMIEFRDAIQAIGADIREAAETFIGLLLSLSVKQLGHNGSLSVAGDAAITYMREVGGELAEAARVLSENGIEDMLREGAWDGKLGA